MKNVKNVIIITFMLVISFVLSAFGMYEFNNYKTFKILNSNGQQYMVQKDYDKAIQSFQQALSYKNDTNTQNNLALAQNLKNENTKNTTISKNIQLANEAANSTKYDEANKYLDEVLKVDPNNSEAKNLKDIFTKTVQDQQEKVKEQEQVRADTQQQNNNTNRNNEGITPQQEEEYTSEMAIQLAKNKVANDFDIKNDVDGYFDGFKYENGKKYAHIRLKCKSYVRDGGSGTILNDYIAKDGSTLY